MRRFSTPKFDLQVAGFRRWYLDSRYTCNTGAAFQVHLWVALHLLLFISCYRIISGRCTSFEWLFCLPNQIHGPWVEAGALLLISVAIPCNMNTLCLIFEYAGIRNHLSQFKKTVGEFISSYHRLWPRWQIPRLHHALPIHAHVAFMLVSFYPFKAHRFQDCYQFFQSLENQINLFLA